MNKNHTGRTGFTLIELLVVIAIIALLAAILFPVFARARENARRSSCQSNLKQLALGIVQYVQDFDERFPPAWEEVGTYDATWQPASEQGWVEIVDPYLKSGQIFQCPSQKTLGTYPQSSSSASRQTNRTDYWYNGNLFFQGGGFTNRGGVNISLLTYTSSTLLFGDGVSDPPLNGEGAVRYFQEGSGTYSMTLDRWGGNPSAANGWAMRHLEGANYAFADGHVKWLKPDKISMTNVPPTGSNFTFALQ